VESLTNVSVSTKTPISHRCFSSPFHLFLVLLAFIILNLNPGHNEEDHDEPKNDKEDVQVHYCCHLISFRLKKNKMKLAMVPRVNRAGSNESNMLGSVVYARITNAKSDDISDNLANLFSVNSIVNVIYGFVNIREQYRPL
jgi:hypothetical protein